MIFHSSLFLEVVKNESSFLHSFFLSNLTILTRTVLLSLGLSSIVGGAALAGTSGNTKIIGTETGEKTKISGSVYGVYVEPDFHPPGGQLVMKDNTLTIQNADTGVHGYMGKHRGVGGTLDLIFHL